jgi:hypothetical protein
MKPGDIMVINRPGKSHHGERVCIEKLFIDVDDKITLVHVTLLTKLPTKVPRPKNYMPKPKRLYVLESELKSEIQHHYSGSLSTDFWARVNVLPELEKRELYFAGVLLQNMEESVLKALASAESGVYKKK